MVPLVEKELYRLVAEGIIEPVQFADWAAPTVPVLKTFHIHVHTVYTLGAQHGSMLCADDPWITLCLRNPGIALAVCRQSF